MSDPLSNPPPPPPPKPKAINTMLGTGTGTGLKPGGPLRSVASPNTIASVHRGISTTVSSSSASTSRTSINSMNNINANTTSTSNSTSRSEPVPQGTDPLSLSSSLSVPVPLITKRPPPPSPVLATPLQPQTPSSPSRVSRKATTANIPAKVPSSSSAAASPASPASPARTQSQIKTKTIKTKPAADAEVDSFLSGPSQRTVHNEESGPGQLPLLKPPPLPSSLSGIQQLEELARRRAWSDVIRISTELLSGALSPYQKYYSQLIRPNTNTNTNTTTNNTNTNANTHNNVTTIATSDEKEITIQKDTVKIIHWRIRSFMYLRRYSELKREVTRMRLIHNQHSSSSSSSLMTSSTSISSRHYNANIMDKLPQWIPLSLILEGIESLEFYSAQSASSSSSSSSLPSKLSDDDTGINTEDEEYEDDLDDILDTLYTIRTNIQAKIHEKSASESKSESKSASLETELEAEAATTSSTTSTSRTYDWHALLKLDMVLSNILTRRAEWRLALKSLDDILLYVHDAVQCWVWNHHHHHHHNKKNNNNNNSNTSWSEKEVDWLTKAVKVEIYSRQGKILLQVGALPAAATIFERAHDEFQDMGMGMGMGIGMGDSTFITRESCVKNVPTQILLNEGLLHFAHMDYDLAETKFTTAIDMIRNEEGGDTNTNTNTTNTTISQQRELYDFDSLIDTEGDLIIPCLNNLALCALYTCRMRDAVNMMEGLVRENPSRYLTQSMAFNLCTLHELGSDNATSEKKKRVLQLIAKRFSLHDIGNESFRLN